MRPPVGSQQHRDVHPPEGIGFDRDLAPAQRVGHVPALSRIAPADENAGRIRRRTGAEEHDIEAVLPKCARGRAGQARPLGAVQHLDPDALAGLGDRVGVAGHALAPRLEQDRHQAEERERGRRDQRGPDDAATRFQNSTVGAGIGHPEPTRCSSRSVATARSTSAGSS